MTTLSLFLGLLRLNIVLNNLSNQVSNQVDANFDLKAVTFNINGQGKGQVKLSKVKTILIGEDFIFRFCKKLELRATKRSVGKGMIVTNNDLFKVHHCFSDPHWIYVGIVGDQEEGKFLILSLWKGKLKILV